MIVWIDFEITLCYTVITTKYKHKERIHTTMNSKLSKKQIIDMLVLEYRATKRAWLNTSLHTCPYTYNAPFADLCKLENMLVAIGYTQEELDNMCPKYEVV